MGRPSPVHFGSGRYSVFWPPIGLLESSNSMMIRVLCTFVLVTLPVLSPSAETTSEALLRRVISTVTSLRADPELPGVLANQPSDDSQLPTLRQFTATWKDVPNDIA